MFHKAFWLDNFTFGMHYVDPSTPIITTNLSERLILDSLQKLYVTFWDKSPRRRGVGHHWPNVYY